MVSPIVNRPRLEAIMDLGTTSVTHFLTRIATSFIIKPSISSHQALVVLAVAAP